MRVLVALLFFVAAVCAVLHRRQISIGPIASVPAQCDDSCSPVNDEINLGCPATACCTSAFETEYYNCLECVGSALDATSYGAAQNTLNFLYTTCVDMGFVGLPRLALPGQNASGSNSTSSAAPTSTGSSQSGSSTTHSSGAIINGEQRGVQALISALVLCCIVGL